MKKYVLTALLLIGYFSVVAQLPVFHWAKAFLRHNGENNPRVHSNARSIAVDNMGNVYSAGQFEYTVDFDPGPGVFALSTINIHNKAMYISKLSPDGDFIWAIQIPTYAEFGYIEIRVDKDNNVLIASELRHPTDFDPGPGVYILTPIGAKDAFVAKYDSDGKLIWAKQFGGPGDTVPGSSTLEIDNSNNVIICGQFNNTVDFDPGAGSYNMTSTAHMQSFIVKLKSNGDFLWAKQFGNSPVVHSNSIIAAIKCDKQGNIFLTGTYAGKCDFDPGPGTYLLNGPGMMNMFIVKIGPEGDFFWAKSLNNNSGDYHQFGEGKGIALDADNNVYTVGYFLGNLDFDPGPNTHMLSSNYKYDWYLHKLTGEGNFEWVNVFSGDEYDVGADVAVDNEGNVYTIGTAGPAADLDPGPGKHIVTAVDGASALVKVNSKGNLIYATTFERAEGNYGSSLLRRMVVDNAHNIYITGNLAGTIDFDPGLDVYPLHGIEDGDPFVLKLGRCKNVTTSILNISTCDSYILDSETFDVTGTYTRTIPNSFGCDSVITLHLTINKKFTEQSKSICVGESFLAGGAFQIISGIYMDTLQTKQNCDSIVTTKLTVNSIPEPDLGADRDLCEGTKLDMNPGSFTQYLWQNGTVSNSLTATIPGLYWVKVTNEYNCSAADSLIIASILPGPDNFLKKKDSLCLYEKISVESLEIFHQYRWSTGSLEKNTLIERPGIYSLQVTDANGCSGTNNISIYQKDCMFGVYIPTAFSPNNDGLNDVWKAMVYGKFKSFKLEVFSREGQIIFRTTDPLNGWNGSYNGNPYSTANFVWQCFYQFEGQKAQYQKGKVMIIR